MARGKHAAALFEVIHSGKSGKPLLRTPSWWFKRRPKKRAQQSQSGDATSGDADEFDPTLGAREISPFNEVPVAPPPSEPADTPTINAIKVDPDRQQITFKLSFHSAAIAGFALLVAVGLAYLVGKKMSRGPAPSIAAQSSEQLRAAPANPEVLNIPNNARQGNPPLHEPESGTVARGPDSDPDNVQDQHSNSGAPPQRDVNLNYVVIQSYPDLESANAARDALIKAGIGCTVEQKLRGYQPNWYSVVGTHGFARVSSPEYNAYLAKINDISQQFAKGKRGFKVFQPMGYKWDRQSGQ